MHQGFFTGDELWLWVDSWAGRSTKQRIINAILLKSRKRMVTICLPPDELVVTNPSVRPISEISVGDLVFTHTGTFQPVIKTFRRYYIGDVIQIKPHKLLIPTKITPEHPVLVAKVKYSLKIPKFCQRKKWKRKEVNYLIKNYHYFKNQIEIARELNKSIASIYAKIRRLKKYLKISYEFEFIEAKNISKEHLLVYPIIKDIEDIKKLKISDFFDLKEGNYKEVKWVKKRNYLVCRGQKTKIKDEVSVDKDFMELMGWYVADGSIYNKREINIACGLSRKNAIRVRDLFSKVFGIKPKIYKRKYYYVRIQNKPIGTFISKLFGIHSGEKKMRLFFLKLPKEKQLSFLHGYFGGDGHWSKKRKVMSFGTKSPFLAYQLVQICLRLGYVPTVKRIIRRGKPFYQFELYTFKPYPARKYRIYKNYLLLPIKEIKTEEYSGFVHNLEVLNDNTYTGFGVTLHNCYTAQSFHQVGRRIRDVTDFIATPIMSIDNYSTTLQVFRGPKPTIATMIRPPIRFRNEPVYAMFDTTEEIMNIGEDEEEGELKEVFLPIEKNEAFKRYLEEKGYSKDEILKECRAIQKAINPQEITSEKQRKKKPSWMPI